MRRRIVRLAVVAVAVGLVLFAVPLAVAVRVAVIAGEKRSLERIALQAAVRVGPTFGSGDPVELPPTDGRRVGIYDPRLRLRTGSGPAGGDVVVQAALSGRVVEGQVGDELVIAVPVSSAEIITGVVRAAQPAARVRSEVIGTWLVLAMLAGLACGAAGMTAQRQARRLSRPLEELARTSSRIAAGDLGCRADGGDVPEISRVAAAYNAMVDELGDMIDRAQRFSAHASHQLRTPLTGLQLGLEEARHAASVDTRVDLRPALDEAADRAAALRRIVEDVLDLTNRPPVSWAENPIPALDALDRAEKRWHGALAADGRRLIVWADPDTGPTLVPRVPTEQILDVLLDNAHRHGHGTVRAGARDLGEILAFDVSDEGQLAEPALSCGDGSTRAQVGGIGLGFARSLAEACGGRLIVTDTDPTTFSVMLPAAAAQTSSRRDDHTLPIKRGAGTLSTWTPRVVPDCDAGYGRRLHTTESASSE
ncbi:HAMP domain-containing sensor histidine kinase [Microlunatus ginsengisoli]|uniref:histidine kinase n=1 Tax=Microlunatus ginsengisoli TaxID=363863 RepID=A0ABP7AKR9_9ACTN